VGRERLAEGCVADLSLPSSSPPLWLSLTQSLSPSPSRSHRRTLAPAVVVCIVSDGRAKINARTLSVLAAMGVYQDGVAKNEVAGKPVTAHIYEYTTQRELALPFLGRRAARRVIEATGCES